ncbi:MAG: hypothetical protein ACLQQB_00730 [Solirubrobacteraceae bacterium]
MQNPRGTEWREHDAEDLDQRMGRGSDRDPVGGHRAARELSAPGERVQGVVVDEPHARDHPQHDRPEHDSRGHGQPFDPDTHARGRYRARGAGGEAARG